MMTTTIIITRRLSSLIFLLLLSSTTTIVDTADNKIDPPPAEMQASFRAPADPPSIPPIPSMAAVDASIFSVTTIKPQATAEAPPNSPDPATAQADTSMVLTTPVTVSALTNKPGETPAPASSGNADDKQNGIKTDTSNPAPAASTVDPNLSKDLVQGLVSSFVPGAAGALGGGGAAAGAGGLGPMSMLPTISKLSGPLAHIITSNGKPSAEDVDTLLKALPEVAVMLGVSSLLSGAGVGGGGNSGAGPPGGGPPPAALGNMDLTKLPPQLVDFVAKGGQIPGIPPAGMQTLIQQYISQTSSKSSGGIGGGSGSIFGGGGGDGLQSSATANLNFSSLTSQQADDMISGKIPLPPLNALPPQILQTVLSGGTLPGLTLEKTETIKQMYMKQMFNGGGVGPGVQTFGSGGPLIGSVYANISNSNSITLKETNQNLLTELRGTDLSKLPPDVLQSVMSGRTPDLAKIPEDVFHSLINKSPQLFGDIVDSELQRAINVNGSINNGKNRSISIRGKGTITTNSEQMDVSSYGISGGLAAPYDVNSLDRKADISGYNQDDDLHQATLWTAVGLGVVGLVTIVLIVVLCWRYHRGRKSSIMPATNGGDHYQQHQDQENGHFASAPVGGRNRRNSISREEQQGATGTSTNPFV